VCHHQPKSCVSVNKIHFGQCKAKLLAVVNDYKLICSITALVPWRKNCAPEVNEQVIISDLVGERKMGNCVIECHTIISVSY